MFGEIFQLHALHYQRKYSTSKSLLPTTLSSNCCREMGARIMFHCGGIAALTLLVNATTAAPLLRYLGLARTEKDGGLGWFLDREPK